MSTVLEQLASLDRAALEATEDIRWGPLTAVFVLATAWWVKGCVFASVGAVVDGRARRWFPATALYVLLVGALADLVAIGLKETFDRARPPEGEALVGLPSSPSFPSGHATMSFAVAAFLSALHPRLRTPLFSLAALIAASRAYLGVHFWLDVLAGAALGIALGLAAARAARRLPLAPVQARPASYEAVSN